LARHLGRDAVELHLFDDYPEDFLAQLLGEQELGQTPAGGEPRWRDQEENRLAAIRRGLQRGLPTFTRCEPALLVDVEEIIAPAFALQPLGKRECQRVVGARVADENTRHSAPS